MEKAGGKWEEEEEEEEVEVEGLQRTRLNIDHSTSNNKNNTVLTSNGNGDSNHHNKNGDIYGGADDSSEVEEVEEELKISDKLVAEVEELKISDNGSLISGFNGGMNDAEAELGEEDGPKSSEKCVYYQNHEGTGSTNGLSLNGHSSTECSAEKNPVVHILDVTIQNLDIGKCLSGESNLQYEKDLKHDSLCDSTLLPSEISLEEDDTSFKSSSYKAIESAAINLVSESDHEVTELDVEGVLNKQNTHDLYCPNCNSCITKRVILRKRKRKLRTSGEDVKRNKLEKIIGSELTSTSADATSDPAHSTVDISLDGNVSHAPNDYDQERQPDVFRCLSCFSIFIPTGNGFKLFRLFGDKREKENSLNTQEPQHIPVVKKSWYSSFFSSDKGELFMEQGIGGRVDVETYNVEELISSNLNKQNGEASSVHQDPSNAQTYFVGEHVKSGITGSKEGGNNILSPSTKRPAEPGKPDNIEAYISMNLNKQNGEASLVHEAPPHAAYTDGELVKSGITGSKGSGNNSEGGPSLENSEATYNHLDSLNNSKDMLPNQESEHQETTLAGKTLINAGEATENATFMPQQDGLKFLIPSNVGSFTVENSTTDQKVDVALQKKSSDEKETMLLLQTPVSLLKEPYKDNKVNISANISLHNEENIGATLLTKSATEIENGEVKINDKDKAYPSEVSQHKIVKFNSDIHANEPLKADGNALILSVQDALLLQKGHVNIGKILKGTPAENSSGDDTIIVVEASEIEPAAAQRLQGITVSAETGNLPRTETQIHVNEQRGTSAEGIQGVDIIKSIVYGGLVESITSLGVVSSAAGADTATFNVLALGLANLIGGLIVIGHNLWELKTDHSRWASSQLSEQVDRYQELLGRRTDFLLHATVTILSFIVFGLLPPVVYGFSFRKSDDRDLKLVAVAAASLLGIIILAIGKAYVKNPPKSYIKTIVYYAVMGLMVSGVSYAVGNVIVKFLEKLGFSQSSLAIALALPETGSTKPAWASY